MAAHTLCRSSPAGTTAGAAPTTPGAPGARPASTAVTPGHIPAYNSARTPGAGLSDAPRLAAARPGAGGLVPPVVSGAATPGAGLKLRDDPIKAAMSDIFHKIGQKEHVEQVGGILVAGAEGFAGVLQGGHRVTV